MSEACYYEFRSIDRPLDSTEMRVLRRLSAQASITSRSFAQHGEFQGDPDRLIAETFDASVCLSDVGYSFTLRLPRGRVPDPDAWLRFAVARRLSVQTFGESILVEFRSGDRAPDRDRPRESWLQELEPLRQALLDGDLRCLYLGWLLGVQSGLVDDDEFGPPLPPGLGRLNWALRVLADFLMLDRTYVAAAAETPTEEEKRRTALELLNRREALVLQRESEEEERLSARAKQREEREAELRRSRLEDLRGREEDIWDEIGERIETTRPNDYDLAVYQIRQLRDLAKMTGTQRDFRAALQLVREEHAGKSSFLRKLDVAGLTLEERD